MGDFNFLVFYASIIFILLYSYIYVYLIHFNNNTNLQEGY